MITHYTIRHEPETFSPCIGATPARWEQTLLHDLTDDEAIQAIRDGDFTGWDVETLDPIEFDLHELSREGVHLFRADDSTVGEIQRPPSFLP